MNRQARRETLKTLGMSALGLGLSRHFLLAGGFANAAETISLGTWLTDLRLNAQKLRQRKISPLRWQEIMDEIYGATPLSQLKDHLNFPRLSAMILEKMPPDRQEYFHRIDLKTLSTEKFQQGGEPRQTLITKIAHVRKGESIPPHGHANMVSAFLCLSGEFDVDLYDRIDEQEGSMIVRHSNSQRRAGQGTWSSISDYRDNVHWLRAKTDDCFLLTCKMLCVEEHRSLRGRVHVDLRDAKPLSGNRLQVQKIDYSRAQELY